MLMLARLLALALAMPSRSSPSRSTNPSWSRRYFAITQPDINVIILNDIVIGVDIVLEAISQVKMKITIRLATLAAKIHLIFGLSMASSTISRVCYGCWSTALTRTIGGRRMKSCWKHSSVDVLSLSLLHRLYFLMIISSRRNNPRLAGQNEYHSACNADFDAGQHAQC